MESGSISDSKDDDSSRRHRSNKRKRSKEYRKKSHKKKNKKRKREYASDSSSSSYSDERRRRKRKKKKKQTKTKRDDYSDDSGRPSFGKYGIIRSSDMTRMKRSFEIWLAEVQGVPDFNGSRYELLEYYKTYMEDYNTATLPHKKYYDYDKWEMDEYRKQQSKEENHASLSLARHDERRHQLERKARAEKLQQEQTQLTKSLMDGYKIQDMKRQADLRAQMQRAYKMGDDETYNRLKERLG